MKSRIYLCLLSFTFLFSAFSKDEKTKIRKPSSETGEFTCLNAQDDESVENWLNRSCDKEKTVVGSSGIFCCIQK